MTARVVKLEIVSQWSNSWMSSHLAVLSEIERLWAENVVILWRIAVCWSSLLAHFELSWRSVVQTLYRPAAMTLSLWQLVRKGNISERESYRICRFCTTLSRDIRQSPAILDGKEKTHFWRLKLSIKWSAARTAWISLWIIITDSHTNGWWPLASKPT